MNITNDPLVVRVVSEIAIINKSAVGLIVTEDNFNLWSENLFATKQAIKQIDTKRKGFTSPINGTIKDLIAEAREATDPMYTMIKLVEKALIVYTLKVQKEAEEHERFLKQQEIERLEAEQKELMEQAVENDSDYALDEAIEVEEQIEEVKHVDTVVSATQRTSHVTTSVSQKWIFELDDFSKVPDEYKMMNDVKVRKAISGEYGTHEIPGLVIFKKANLTSRRR